MHKCYLTPLGILWYTLTRPCGNPVDYLWITLALPRRIVDKIVDNLWKTWGRGGRRGGEIVTVPARIQKKPKIGKK